MCLPLILVRNMFARNLKPEQISLDVLKGKSKLEFIELNEEVLTYVLELPPWLRIKRAYCIGVTVSVPWTKLKSCPVEIVSFLSCFFHLYFFIDEINVEVVLTNESPHKNQDRPVRLFIDEINVEVVLTSESPHKNQDRPVRL
ncbi:unnamed protein product, partial [Strongylus vulgaris]